ncbi:LysR substrate-binding domain-containing protein, partial [Burkholderia cepacia]
GMPGLTEQLRQLPCITTLSTLKGQPWQFADRDGRIHKIPVASRYRVNSGEMAGLAAVNGVGFAILVERACAVELAEGRLVRNSVCCDVSSHSACVSASSIGRARSCSNRPASVIRRWRV